MWRLYELILSMCLIGLNFTDCSHSLLSEFCNVDAANLLIECDLCNGRTFCAKFGLEGVKGICDKIEDFKLGLLEIFGIVNCDKIGK